MITDPPSSQLSHIVLFRASSLVAFEPGIRNFVLLPRPRLLFLFLMTCDKRPPDFLISRSRSSFPRHCCLSSSSSRRLQRLPTPVSPEWHFLHLVIYAFKLVTIGTSRTPCRTFGWSSRVRTRDTSATGMHTYPGTHPGPNCRLGTGCARNSRLTAAYLLYLRSDPSVN